MDATGTSQIRGLLLEAARSSRIFSTPVFCKTQLGEKMLARSNYPMTSSDQPPDFLSNQDFRTDWRGYMNAVLDYALDGIEDGADSGVQAPSLFRTITSATGTMGCGWIEGTSLATTHPCRLSGSTTRYRSRRALSVYAWRRRITRSHSTRSTRRQSALHRPCLRIRAPASRRIEPHGEGSWTASTGTPSTRPSADGFETANLFERKRRPPKLGYCRAAAGKPPSAFTSRRPRRGCCPA